ncbi:TadE family protein [Mediterraneibacter sp.]|uniref:TadE family protein n=1 Tax=Mediterraneibacter sp. TaxID=2316022 RepID=UPI0027B9F39F|nr:TadE family protein [Mediterraneibacter sp.]
MDIKKEKWVKGSSVIEMSYIMPLLFSLFVIIINTSFYYHDKAIIGGAAIETAAAGAQLARRSEKNCDMETLFQQRIYGKLIYMTDVNVKIEVIKNEVQVSAEAERGFMKIKVRRKANIVIPEKKIRLLK